MTKTRTCTAPGCTNKYLARGYCQNHYKKYRRQYVEPDIAFPLEEYTGDAWNDALLYLKRMAAGGPAEWVATQSRWSIDRVRAVRHAYRYGEPIADLAKEYDTTTTTMANMVKYVTYRQVM